MQTDPPTHARGYGVTDTTKPTEFSIRSFKLKDLTPTDIDIDIKYCGVCGSDVHCVTGGWGPLKEEWTCAGHEIVGVVTHVGPEVTEYSVGDRVGVGAQVWSCGDCNRCVSGNENYCIHLVHTYNDRLPDGTITKGGYADHIRVDEQFVFPIPLVLSDEEAGPMLCSGLTVYSPLVRNGVGPGKHVGIVGVGGLGHMAIQFAKALGAKVTVFSHSAGKETDARAMGADDFINTSDPNFAQPFIGRDEFDLILSCANINTSHLPSLLSLIRITGRFISVGLSADPWRIDPNMMVSHNSSISVSHLGSKKEAIEMMKLAVDKNVRAMTEILPMKDVGVAIGKLMENKARYRYVLKMDL